MKTLRCHFRWVLEKHIAVVVCGLVGVSGLAFAQERTAGASDAAAKLPPSVTADSEAGRKTPNAPRSRLFDLLVAAYDWQKLGWYAKSIEVFQSGALGSNEAGALRCIAHATHECGDAFDVLRSISPPGDAYDERKAAGDLRQRALVCEVANSTDPSLKTGDFDRVGDYALVREELHSAFKGTRVDGADVDILKVYIYLDRVCKGGNLVADLVPRLVYDVGSYLFANADYFLNTANPNHVKKANDQALKDAAKSLASAIADTLESGKAPYPVASHKAQFEECRK